MNFAQHHIIRDLDLERSLKKEYVIYLFFMKFQNWNFLLILSGGYRKTFPVEVLVFCMLHQDSS